MNDLEKRLASRLKSTAEPAPPPSYTRINLRLLTPIADRLKELATNRGMSVTQYITWLVKGD